MDSLSSKDLSEASATKRQAFCEVCTLQCCNNGIMQASTKANHMYSTRKHLQTALQLCQTRKHPSQA